MLMESLSAEKITNQRIMVFSSSAGGTHKLSLDQEVAYLVLDHEVVVVSGYWLVHVQSLLVFEVESLRVHPLT